jgi:hypothetical protein
MFQQMKLVDRLVSSSRESKLGALIRCSVGTRATTQVRRALKAIYNHFQHRQKKLLNSPISSTAQRRWALEIQKAKNLPAVKNGSAERFKQ